MADPGPLVSTSEPCATAPDLLVGATRLEALVCRLFPVRGLIDLADPAAVHLRRTALTEGRRPAFRWCEVAAPPALDWFEAHPPASIWEVDVIPVHRADGAINPAELGGCARTHRQPVVRLCGQLVAGAAGEETGRSQEERLLQELLHPPGS